MGTRGRTGVEREHDGKINMHTLRHVLRCGLCCCSRRYVGCDEWDLHAVAERTKLRSK
jgi:hypothetical protein